MSVLLGRSGAAVMLGLDQAACVQVLQAQSAQVQLAQLSVQLAHSQVAWLHVLQVQSEQLHIAQESVQLPHWQVSHSS